MVEYLNQPWRRVYKPLTWQRQGLQQTASGYGNKLTSSYVARFVDDRATVRERRIYVTQYSNAGTAWIIVGGKELVLRDCDQVE
jgi:hypothetical protein